MSTEELQVNQPEKAKPLFDLKPKKTFLQAFLIYLTFLGLELVICLTLLVAVVITMQTLNLTIDPDSMKIKAKLVTIYLNAICALVFGLIIMKAKNLLKSFKAYILLVLSACLSFMIGSIAGFILLGILTGFSPEEK